jgi:hypothetical protein
MATSYEVHLRVQPESSARSLRDVLTQTLAHTGDFARSPQVDQLPEDDPMLLVTLWLDADDASTAQLAAGEAVRKALTDAGLDVGAAVIRDADVRASS